MRTGISPVPHEICEEIDYHVFHEIHRVHVRIDHVASSVHDPRHCFDQRQTLNSFSEFTLIPHGSSHPLISPSPNLRRRRLRSPLLLLGFSSPNVRRRAVSRRRVYTRKVYLSPNRGPCLLPRTRCLVSRLLIVRLMRSASQGGGLLNDFRVI